MWIPSTHWVDGVLCGNECYKQLAARHFFLTEEGLHQIADAYAREFYPTDVERRHEFYAGFVRGYRVCKNRDTQQAREEETNG